MRGKKENVWFQASQNLGSLWNRRQTRYNVNRRIRKWVSENVLLLGLLFIKNPFTSIGQRYWTVKCLQDYSKKPNKTNIDTLNLVPENKEWWEMCQNNNNVLLLNKLRWVTLGYHHNWDTKVGRRSDVFIVINFKYFRYITKKTKANFLKTWVIWLFT